VFAVLLCKSYNCCARTHLSRYLCSAPVQQKLNAETSNGDSTSIDVWKKETPPLEELVVLDDIVSITA